MAVEITSKKARTDLRSADRAGHLVPVRTLAAVVAILLVLCLSVMTIGPVQAGTAPSASWTQFRYDSSHAGFNPVEHTLTTANVKNLVMKWHTGTDSTYGDPVVAGGSIFLTERANGYCVKLEALNATTGKSEWSHSFKAFQCPDPAVAGNAVILVTRAPYAIHAWNVTTGKLMWSKTLGSGRYSAPTTADGDVYIAAPNGYVHAWLAATGRQAWAQKVKAALTSAPPAVYRKTIFLDMSNGSIYAANAATGHKEWIVSGGAPAQTDDATIAAADGMVFVSQNLSQMFAVNIAEKKVAWRASGIEFTPQFAVAYGLVYAVTSPQGPHGQGPSVFAFNDQTGKQVWSFTTGFDGIGPEVANGVLYVSNDGTATASAFFALNAKTGKQLWKTNGAGSYPSYPAIVNGWVYVNNYAWGLNPAAGKPSVGS